MTVAIRQHKQGGFVLVAGRRRLTMEIYRSESSAKAARAVYMKQAKGSKHDDALCCSA